MYVGIVPLFSGWWGLQTNKELPSRELKMVQFP